MDTKSFLAGKIKEIERYCAAKQMGTSTFGVKAANTSDLYRRLCGSRGNVNIKLGTLMKVEEYIAKNK